MTTIRNQFSKWDSVKVKARYDYICAKCNSTENIQAHDPTRQHNNWRVGIALCGTCHAKEHPDMPAGLFSIKTHQPYWPNISARSLAKEFGIGSQTIVKRAKRLNIPPNQILSPELKEKLRGKIAHYNHYQHKCKQCGHEWYSKSPRPLRCAKCLTRYWDKEEKETNNMARYDSLRKIERNKALKEYAQNNPALSMKEIGKVFGISESRVWRILNGHKEKDARP